MEGFFPKNLGAKKPGGVFFPKKKFVFPPPKPKRGGGIIPLGPPRRGKVFTKGSAQRGPKLISPPTVGYPHFPRVGRNGNGGPPNFEGGLGGLPRTFHEPKRSFLARGPAECSLMILARRGTLAILGRPHEGRAARLTPWALYATGREDGRHRAHAARELGINRLPVLVWE